MTFVTLRALAGLLLVTSFAVPPINAQDNREAPIERRLRSALGLGNSDNIQITRDYSALLPSLTFFRTRVWRGVHARPLAAALVVRGTDTVLVREPSDLAPLWIGMQSASRPTLEHSVAIWTELLFQSGLLPACARRIDRQEQIDPAYRTFLTEGADLDAIHAPRLEPTGDGRQLVFFLQSVRGIAQVIISEIGQENQRPDLRWLARFEAN